MKRKIASSAAFLVLLGILVVGAVLWYKELVDTRSPDPLRIIFLAQREYAIEHPDKGFATSLEELGNDSRGSLIDSVLASGTKSGYEFILWTAGPILRAAYRTSLLSLVRGGIRTVSVVSLSMNRVLSDSPPRIGPLPQRILLCVRLAISRGRFRLPGRGLSLSRHGLPGGLRRFCGFRASGGRGLSAGLRRAGGPDRSRWLCL